MELPTPGQYNFSSLLNDIEKGQIKIPQFQRDFVWDIKKSAHLIDSLIKGYPIGTFIFWRTKERLRTIRNIGNREFPIPDEGDFVNYVLDGQQRLTTLYASLNGLLIEKEAGNNLDYSEIYIDLNAEENDQIVITDIQNKPSNTVIKVIDLLKGDFSVLAGYPGLYHDKLRKYKKRIESYIYSVIEIKEAPIDIATEIFTRINTSGKPLTLFEIMTAKTYDSDKDFDLSEKFNELTDNLKSVKYETISDANVLHLVSLLLKKECKRKIILSLAKDDFISIWDTAVDAIERAVDYFRGYFRIPVSQLLPYNALVVPFAYFFSRHKDRPTDLKQSYLEDFFWRCSLSNRYSSSVESKLAQDIKRIDTILTDELPKYDWPIDPSQEFIAANGWFSVGRSYIKAMLCIYAYHQPKSFIDDSIVNINNEWLKQANSKNYHHFFPKSYLKKTGESPENINHILNITIVDDFLNKRAIRAKTPAEYMAEFKIKNQKLADTMRTHLIDDLEGFGIWENNYDKFFNSRAKAVSDFLTSRIITQDVDKQEKQTKIIDDVEETEME